MGPIDPNTIQGLIHWLEAALGLVCPFVSLQVMGQEDDKHSGGHAMWQRPNDHSTEELRL